jgi:hypothetical protein
MHPPVLKKEIADVVFGMVDHIGFGCKIGHQKHGDNNEAQEQKRFQDLFFHEKTFRPCPRPVIAGKHAIHGPSMAYHVP